MRLIHMFNPLTSGSDAALGDKGCGWQRKATGGALQVWHLILFLVCCKNMFNMRLILLLRWTE